MVIGRVDKTDHEKDGRSETDDDQLDAWERTIEEMEALAEEREADGWKTLTITPADTAPTPPEAGDDDRYGLIYTVGSGVVEEFRAANEAGFDRYNVYRRGVGSRLFLVTELQSAAAERTVFIAGAVDRSLADRLITAAGERGEMYTHLQTLDGTRLGTVRHDDPSAFFPSL